VTRRSYTALRRAALDLDAARPTAPLWHLAAELATAVGCHQATAYRHLKAVRDGDIPLAWGGPPDRVAAQMRTILITSDMLAALAYIQTARDMCFDEVAQRGLDQLIAALWTARDA
jgi:mono/diheme cytochrome c family protein